MLGLHIKVFNNDQWNAVKPALATAGHAEIASLTSNVTTFLHTLETKYPDVVAAIKQGIVDVKDHNLSGGEKAVKVATDVLAVAPAVLADLPGIKDALVAGVTHMFADDFSDFKKITADMLAAL